MAKYKKGELIVDEDVVGVKDAADWEIQGFKLYEPPSTAAPPASTIPANKPITTDQISEVGQTEEVFEQSKSQQDYLTKVTESYQEAGQDALANTAFIQAVSQAHRGKPATSEELAHVSSGGAVGGSLKDVLTRFGLLDKMPGLGVIKPSTSTEPLEGEVVPKVLTALEQKEQLLQSYISDRTAYSEKAIVTSGMSETQKLYSEGKNVANDILRDVESMQRDKDLQSIFNEETKAAIKDSIEGQGRGIPLSIVIGQITKETAAVSREQRMDELLDIYKINKRIDDYNHQLRKNQILQGDYLAAKATHTQMMIDWKDLKTIEFDILEDKGDLEKDERDRLENEVEYERKLALEKGLVHISSDEEYNKIVKDMRVTADTFNNFFYKDPTNDKIYLRTGEGDVDTQVITAGGRSLLINKRTGETIRDLGFAYKGGSGGGSGGVSGDVSGGVSSEINTLAEMYNRGESLGSIGATKKAQVIQRAEELRMEESNTLEGISGLIKEAETAGDAIGTINRDLQELGYDKNLINEALRIRRDDFESEEQNQGFFNRLFLKPFTPGGEGGGSF